MHCASCVARVEKALAAVPGVQVASVDLLGQRADVSTADGDPPEVERLIEAVRGVGFDAAPRATTGPAVAGGSPESVGTLSWRFAYTFAAAWVTMFLSMPLMHHGGPAAHGPASPFAFVMQPLDALTRALLPGLYDVPADVLRWALFAVTLPVLLWSGRGFYVRTWRGIRRGTLDMDTLVAIGTGTAFVVSVLVTIAPARVQALGLPPDVWYEAVPWVISLITLGRLLEERAKRRAGQAVRALAERVPRTARVVRDGREVDVPLERVVVGDLVVLRPGERVPVDGEIVRGRTSVDESMLTGESVPVRREEGDELAAGTTNGPGGITFRATGVGQDTAIARVIRLLEDAMAAKPPIQRAVDRVAAVFVPVVLGIGVVAFGAWLVLGPGPAFALRAFVTVLIIACPCAMGLAVPAAVSVATGLAARRGILVREGSALEVAGTLDTVVLDKTGTVTEGRPEVVAVRVAPGASVGEDGLVALAASLEARSEHPLAGAVLREAERRGLSVPGPETAFAQAGGGMFGRVGGRKVRVGRAEFLREKGVDPGPLAGHVAALEADGATPVLVGADGAALGVLGVRDPLREDAAAGVAALKRLGLRVVLLSGDRRAVVELVGREIDADEVVAEASPEGKVEHVRGLRARGARVVMVGDGVNDAPSLAAADVGVAIGTGTDVARGAADVTLVGGHIAAVADFVRLSRRTTRIVRQNLAWAFGYNALGIPIAAGVLYPWTGWLLSPVFASAAMALSSVSVVSNSLRLRAFR
jgi:Cu+-exporting ATPase